MHKFLLIFFLALPFLELYLFFQVTSLIGFILSFMILLITCTIGLYILKFSSFIRLFNLNESLKGAQTQPEKIFKHLCIIFGGVFLLFPGFLTDLISLLIFLPFFQNVLYKSLSRRVFNIINQDINDSKNESQVIDVDYVSLDDKR